MHWRCYVEGLKQQRCSEEVAVFIEEAGRYREQACGEDVFQHDNNVEAAGKL
jgi:hypothetical protein